MYGCSTSWVGRSQAVDFKYMLKLKNGLPAENVGALCTGNAGTDSISQTLAQKINLDKPISNKEGLLMLTRPSSEVYGSYSYFWPFTFNKYSTSLEITCELTYEGKTIHNLLLNEHSEPQVIILSK